MTAKRRKRTKRRGPLSAWVEMNGLTLTQAAGLIGMSVQHVSNLLHGHSTPSRDAAVRIERATGGRVTVESWGR
jgi:plasmid maintenance system antidote protein VapI